MPVTPVEPVPGRTLASFGQRVAAFLLDTVVHVVLALGFGGLVVVPALLVLDGGQPVTGPGVAAFALAAVGMIAASVVAPVAYRAETTSRRAAATWGKWLVGLEVVDRRTGGRLPRRRAWGREAFNYLISGQIYVGQLWMLWDEEQRTLHDMALRTHVVVREGPRPPFGDLFRR